MFKDHDHFEREEKRVFQRCYPDPPLVVKAMLPGKELIVDNISEEGSLAFKDVDELPKQEVFHLKLEDSSKSLRIPAVSFQRIAADERDGSVSIFTVFKAVALESHHIEKIRRFFFGSHPAAAL